MKAESFERIEKHRELAKFLAEKAEIQRQLSAAERAVDEVLDFRNKAATNDRLDGPAREFLRTGQVPPAGATYDGAELDARIREREVLRRALKLKEGDETELRLKLSHELNLEIEPEYRQVIRDIVRVLTDQLAPLLTREKAIRVGLQDAGYRWNAGCTLVALPLHALGDPSDPLSRFSMYISEVRKHGYAR